MGMGITHAYIPTTWIQGTPQNIYSPSCTINASQEGGVYRPFMFEPEINIFTLAQKSQHMYGQCNVAGLGFRGTLYMDRMLRGLYSQIAIAALTNHGRIHDQASHVKHVSSSNLADSTITLGWKMLNRKNLGVSAYIFGTIPAPHCATYTPGIIRNWVGLDRHVTWGTGMDLWKRLWGTKLHHIDWLSDAQITFLTKRHAHAWMMTPDGYQLCPITIHAHELYKLQSTLAYQFKNFISDVGVQCFYMPAPYYDNYDTATQYDRRLESSDLSVSLLCDVGAVFPCNKASWYCSLGAQLTEYNHSFDMWSANLKTGVRF
jgi:hypothetical protein